MAPVVASCSYLVGDFQILSASALEIDENYNLVKGDDMRVVNSNGEVIHEGIRGFMPLNETYHLVRMADKSWWCCTISGAPKQKSALRKKNLVLGSLALMFDERGKIRLGQQSVHFQMLSL